MFISKLRVYTSIHGPSKLHPTASQLPFVSVLSQELGPHFFNGRLCVARAKAELAHRAGSEREVFQRAKDMLYAQYGEQAGFLHTRWCVTVIVNAVIHCVLSLAGRVCASWSGCARCEHAEHMACLATRDRQTQVGTYARCLWCRHRRFLWSCRPEYRRRWRSGRARDMSCAVLWNCLRGIVVETLAPHLPTRATLPQCS